MGQVRLLVLPRSKKWQRAIKDLWAGADVSAIVDRVHDSCVDWCGRQSWRLNVVHGSNCYPLRDLLRSASDFGSGTRTDALISSEQAPARDCVREFVGPLKVALASGGATIKAKEDRIRQEGGGIACALGTAT